MPRTAKQYEAMRAATHSKIVSAAASLFAQKGLSGTNVQDIADLAGISVGLLYRHYRTKEALFDALVEEASDGLKEVTEMLLSAHSPADMVRTFCKQYVVDISQDEDYTNTILFITQAITSGNQNNSLQLLMQRDRDMFAAWEALIAKGQKEGAFRRGNPYDLALLFCSALQGIGQFKLLLNDAYRAPAAELLASILLQNEACDYATK